MSKTSSHFSSEQYIGSIFESSGVAFRLAPTYDGLLVLHRLVIFFEPIIGGVYNTVPNLMHVNMQTPLGVLPITTCPSAVVRRRSSQSERLEYLENDLT